jgi:hypothetical protein
MGQQETKPSFPSDEQWNAWRKERDEKISGEIANLEKRRGAEMSENIHRTMELFDDYMSACHDKSKFKKFFMDNDDCTTARQKLTHHIAGTVKGYMNDEAAIAGMRAVGGKFKN